MYLATSVLCVLMIKSISTAPSSNYPQNYITDNNDLKASQNEPPSDALFIWEQFTLDDQKNHLMPKLKTHIENICKCSKQTHRCQVDDMLEHGENRFKTMEKDQVDRMDPQISNDIFHKMMEGHEMMSDIPKECLDLSKSDNVGPNDAHWPVSVLPPADFSVPVSLAPPSPTDYVMAKGPAQYILPPPARHQVYYQRRRYIRGPTIIPIRFSKFMNQNYL